MENKMLNNKESKGNQSKTPMKPEQAKLKKKKDKDHTVRNVVIAVIILILLLLGLRSCGTGDGDIKIPNLPTWNIGDKEGVEDITNDTRSQEEIQAELNEKVAESNINISMNLNPIFKTANDKGSLMIVNSNVNNYMQIVEIYRDDTNELIYTSPAIPVGKQVKTAKLDVLLAKGEYKCTAYFNAVKEDGTYVGKAAAKVTITIQN